MPRGRPVATTKFRRNDRVIIIGHSGEIGVVEAILTALAMSTNRALTAAREHAVGWPVNWASVCCIDAVEWRSVHGDTGLTVVISEASPDAHELRAFVAEWLKDEFGDVEVLTEW